MHREAESADRPVFSQIQPITQTTLFMLINVLHCTNTNTDFIDFYGGVKRPHPTIHSRHVYNSQLVL